MSFNEEEQDEFSQKPDAILDKKQDAKSNHSDFIKQIELLQATSPVKLDDDSPRSCGVNLKTKVQSFFFS